MRELRREFTTVFGHWLVAVVGLSVATGIGGAIFVPPANASFAGRALATCGGVAVGLLLAAVGVLAVVLIRRPLREYRTRNREQRLGQQCVDCGRDVVRCFEVIGLTIEDGPAISGEYDPAAGERALRELKQITEGQFIKIEFRFEHECARRVYRCATELYESDHIDRDERDSFRSVPAIRSNGTPERRMQSATEILSVGERLLHFGVRLGGKL